MERRKGQEMQAIVHIGAPKAGSSAIQSAIRLNAAALEAQGIHPYRPTTGPSERALALRFHPDRTRLPPRARMKLKSAQAGWEWSLRCWEDLAQDIRTSRPETTLISSEHFFGLPDPAEFIAALREIFSEITLVAYVRDPVDQYRSRTDQHIRGGQRFRDLQMFDEYRHYARSGLQTYLEILGPERMVVRNFDRANLVGGDVVKDFFARLGAITGREIALETVPPRANESLCAAATVWLMTANECFLRVSDEDDHALLKQRYEVIERLRKAEALAGMPKLKFDDPQMTALIRRNSRDCCLWLNRTFLEGQVPIETGVPDAEPLKPTEIRARMHDWFLACLAPDALDAVLRVAVPLEGGAPRKGKKTEKEKRQKKRAGAAA